MKAINEREVDSPKDTLVVGWFGRARTPDDLAETTYCTHCTHCSHTTKTCNHRYPDGPQVICLSHPVPDEFNPGSILGWPELNYDKVVKEIDSKQELLNSLAAHGVGLTLLHGHSNEFMFTKLPEGYVSVITNGATTFRKESDVAKDKNFVPNMWRSINGKLQVAGGFSEVDLEITSKL